MVTLKGKQLFLRALEPEDIDFLYKLENDETIWQVSETQTPYSRYVLKQYLKNSYKDIYEVKQLRLAIVSTLTDWWDLSTCMILIRSIKELGLGSLWTQFIIVKG